MDSIFENYADNLGTIIANHTWNEVENLAEAMLTAWQENKQLFLCGNGGSAGNAIHLANDYLYGVASNTQVSGMRVEALSANPAVISCLANDVGYSEIFSEQLLVKGNVGDLLLVLSGSGNSPNVVRALEVANEIGMKTFAIVGYSGGRCVDLAQTSIHFRIDDMQISEDLQLIVGHMCMRWLMTKVAKIHKNKI